MPRAKAAKPDWKSLKMSPRAEEFFRSTYLPRYQELLKEVESTPLCVLVWGPGPNGGDLYAKRCQIRAELLAMGIAAVFSEEIDAIKPTRGTSANIRELLQAIAADFIIVLQASAGSIAEVHDFASFHRDIGRKMLIFIDDRYIEGYSYSGALLELRTLYSNVRTYHFPEDITECHLTGLVKSLVQTLRHAKWRAELSERT